LILSLVAAALVSSCDTGLVADRVTTAPLAPVPVAPSNRSSDEANAVSLSWEPVDGAEYYQAQLSRSPGFVAVDEQKNGLIQTHLDVRDLEMHSVYYWRVRAGNEIGVGDWSETWTFTPTLEAHMPASTALSLPPDRAINQPTEILFKWAETTGATSYQLDVALDPFFNSTFASIQGIEDTNRFIYGLVKTYTYYWRVRGYNPAGFGPWSPTRYIIIEGLVDQDGR